ncbi:hypothetical protein H696_04555 [Fonticula alba]|uniref:Secretory carrier membrane protein n=1 Tax=Fonticula alba TaxID=691883 RepID=A0A058Z4E7_FONAL|nr:hypothetical protein H696_04555 [Fonticula alba]KCV69140.1 hypothetical protein H696_04555 [Fonticula alba]|eukprot:XP_009496711.1 hypothetical protein H696_04555 [Fonticula alba]
MSNPFDASGADDTALLSAAATQGGAYGTSHTSAYDSGTPFPNAYDTSSSGHGGFAPIGGAYGTSDNTASMYDSSSDTPAPAAAAAATSQPVVSGSTPAPNWPPFRPMIYHSIQGDIPTPYQSLAKKAYFLNFVMLTTLVLNFFGGIAIVATGNSVWDLIYSVIFLLLVPPGAFYLWYLRAYRALQHDSALQFWIFFASGVVNIGFALYGVLGPYKTGAVGIINMIRLFDSGKIGGGVVALLSTVGWVFWSILSFLIFTSMLRRYRERGHTFQEARNQAMTKAATNPDVQSAALTGATAAAQSYYV